MWAMPLRQRSAVPSRGSPGFLRQLGANEASHTTFSNTRPSHGRLRAPLDHGTYCYDGVEFAARRRMPAMFFFDLFADAGGLMAFGASPEDSYRRAAHYI